MGVFEMIVAVVAITIVGSIIREAVKKKEIKPKEMDAISQRLDRLEKLEERVQTLETIVTDRKEELKREIDAL